MTFVVLFGCRMKGRGVQHQWQRTAVLQGDAHRHQHGPGRGPLRLVSEFAATVFGLGGFCDRGQRNISWCRSTIQLSGVCWFNIPKLGERFGILYAVSGVSAPFEPKSTLHSLAV